MASKQQQTVQYETMLVCNPNLDDAEVRAEINKVSELINARGGKLEKNIVWGKKELSYPIQKFKYGIYVQLIFSSPEGAVVAEIDRALRISDGVIRFLTVIKDQYAPEEAPAFQEDPFARGRGSRGKRRFDGEGEEGEMREGDEFAGAEDAAN